MSNNFSLHTVSLLATFVRVKDNRLYLFLFIFSFLFYFILFLFLELELEISIILYITVRKHYMT